MPNTDQFETEKTMFVEVVLPLSLAKNYTYRVPLELNDEVTVGKRVIVQFGRQRMYTALIKSIGFLAPEHYQAKYIIDVIDTQPILSPEQRQFWEWMASYYVCNEGDVMNAAIPAGLKLASETVIVLRTDEIDHEEALTDQEQLIIEALTKQKKLSVDAVMELLGQRTVYPVINNLLFKDRIIIQEEVNEKYRPMRKSFISLKEFYKDDAHLKELFTVLERAPKQLDILLSFIKLSRNRGNITKQELLEDCNGQAATLKTLVTKEILSEEKKVVSRLSDKEAEELINFTLSPAQSVALESIKEIFSSKDVVLLHGVTSSGKTQVYIKLIEDALESGKQVLFLVPEIALTTQIVERIRIYFGAQVGVYHSKFNNNERVEIWNAVLDGRYKVVLGARSAVFLPFKTLGLIVVDEEHESSYKQYDPAPRYQARDAAIYLGSLYGAKIVLGSATPSIESYYNAKVGKYALVSLKERFGSSEMPDHEIVSISESQKKKKMTAYFTAELLEEIDRVIQAKEQVILFQNRRGYATILICATCGFTPKCINCDVSLTYHKASGKLHCHYCGFSQSILQECPACGSVHIMQKGFGTERIEEELKVIYPDIRTARLDLDSTRGKHSMQQIISDFQDKKTNVLIGTQMVAKGLDFNDVTLIGVINADTMLNFPDFRAYERSFQLLAQVGGRSGRREKPGKVLIQTYDSGNRIIGHVVKNDYEAMYEEELQERKQFHYPPFTRLINLNVKHKDPLIVHQAAKYLATLLRTNLSEMIFGPEQPLISRVRNLYIEQIMIRAEKELQMSKVKAFLKQAIQQLNTEKNFKSVRVQVDVDPA